MNILILGGTHLTGPWIIKSLQKYGHKITIFNRGQTKAHTDIPPEINRIYGDRRHLIHHKNELQKLAPEVVIDMNAMTESDAQQLIDIFPAITSRIIVISSGDVYMAHEKLCQSNTDIYDPIPLHENSKLREKKFPYRQYAKNIDDIYYSYDKSLVEKIINHANINSTILRFPFVYGQGDYSRVLPYLKNMVDKNPEILLDEGKAKWATTRGYVEDLAIAITKAILDQRKGKFIYNVGEINALTEKEWIQKIATLMNWQGKIVEKEKNNLPENLREPYDWKQAIVYDTTKIRDELQYKEAYSTDQALAKTIEWILANMPSE
jgi:nucleoside-diphosphate-sugar epimerase